MNPRYRAIGRGSILLPVALQGREVEDPAGARRQAFACGQVSWQRTAGTEQVRIPAPGPAVDISRPGIVNGRLATAQRRSWPGGEDIQVGEGVRRAASVP